MVVAALPADKDTSFCHTYSFHFLSEFSVSFINSCSV